MKKRTTRLSWKKSSASLERLLSFQDSFLDSLNGVLAWPRFLAILKSIASYSRGRVHGGGPAGQRAW